MSKPPIQKWGTFPTQVFLVVVGVVCLGLAASAAHGFLTLSRLHNEVLRNRGHEIVEFIDRETRGPGRRSNPVIWKEVMEESWETNQNSVAFLILRDQSGQVLASAGARPDNEPGGSMDIQESDLYVFEEVLPSPRHPPRGITELDPDGWRLRVGLYTSPADAIKQQAYVHLLVAAVAILMLLVLTFYFLRTLRRFLELQARQQSERHLAALGKLAATLAHEIRNPLGAMKGLTQVIQEELPRDHRAQTLMQTVVSEAERLEQLVVDLLTFARPRDSQINRFDLRALIADVRSMLESKLTEAQVTIDTVIEPEPLVIQSDENGVRQVLLNILLNAIDASSCGGRITVSARRDEGARQVMIEIDDNGAGLGDRDPEELFQPFVTTKVKGTGLGLAVSRQIVERSGGTMTLANRSEGGARCTIRLPVSVR